MIKKLISKLYHKLFPQGESVFLLQDLTVEQQNALFIGCKTLSHDPYLRQVMQIVSTESENRQLFELSNAPITTTEAELERQRRAGVEQLKSKIDFLAEKAPKPITEEDPEAKYAGI